MNNWPTGLYHEGSSPIAGVNAPAAGGHPLSLKDANLSPYLQELEDMGVACLKLEGRMKRPEYVAVVTGIYAAALRQGREPAKNAIVKITQTQKQNAERKASAEKREETRWNLYSNMQP